MQDIAAYRADLVDWYQQHKRDLPWRHTKDPYRIWLSEIILQQTRVVQGLPYYERFVRAFPTVQDLANASEDEVLTLWKGLGYYSRARNLHHAAKTVMDEFGGKFPDNYKDILTLKGVGQYTAAAISSFAFGEVQSVVDGNVIRVISRLYGITDAVDDTKTLKRIKILAEQLIDTKCPDTYNQAIMEFGALQCLPKSSPCQDCCLMDQCKSYKLGIVDQVPYKAKKIKRKSRYFHYIIAVDSDNTIMQRREDKDIWQGLYQFPLIETSRNKKLGAKDIQESLRLSKVKLSQISEVSLQKLTHRDIHARFYHIEAKMDEILANDAYFLVDQKKVSNFALPKVIDAYLRDQQA